MTRLASLFTAQDGHPSWLSVALAALADAPGLFFVALFAALILIA